MRLNYPKCHELLFILPVSSEFLMKSHRLCKDSERNHDSVMLLCDCLLPLVREGSKNWFTSENSRQIVFMLNKSICDEFLHKFQSCIKILISFSFNTSRRHTCITFNFMQFPFNGKIPCKMILINLMIFIALKNPENKT